MDRCASRGPRRVADSRWGARTASPALALARAPCCPPLPWPWCTRAAIAGRRVLRACCTCAVPVVSHATCQASDQRPRNPPYFHRDEEEAARALQGMQGRYYAGKPIVVEFSPVTGELARVEWSGWEVRSGHALGWRCVRGIHCVGAAVATLCDGAAVPVWPGAPPAASQPPSHPPSSLPLQTSGRPRAGSTRRTAAAAAATATSCTCAPCRASCASR